MAWLDWLHGHPMYVFFYAVGKMNLSLCTAENGNKLNDVSQVKREDRRKVKGPKVKKEDSLISFFFLFYVFPFS